MSATNVTAQADDGFRWYYSLDGECWSLAGGSRDDAIVQGREEAEGGTFYICEASKEPLRDSFFEADEVIAAFADHNEELWGEGGFEGESSAEANAELQTMLNTAFTAWRTKHTDWQAYTFREMRNEEEIAAVSSDG